MSFAKFKVKVRPRDDTKRNPETISNGNAIRQLPGHPSLAFLQTKSQSQLQVDAQTFDGTIECSSNATSEADAIANYLINLTKTLLKAFARRDFKDPLIQKHFSPNFSGKHDDLRSTKGAEDHLTVWTERMRSMPNFHEQIIDVAVDVHGSGRKAKIWTLKRLTGIPPSEPIESRSQSYAMKGGVSKEGIAIVDWEVKGDVWMCMRVQMIWGVCEFS